MTFVYFCQFQERKFNRQNFQYEYQSFTINTFALMNKLMGKLHSIINYYFHVNL
jgi:hypothetical protein